MGYKSTLVVAEISDACRDNDGRAWLNPIAIFDLSKMGYDGHFAELVADAGRRIDGDRYYWYPHLASGAGDAADVRLHTDPYGEPPTTLDFDTTILALEADDDGYRRIAPVVAALKVYAAQLAAGKWHPNRFGLFHIGH